MTKRRCAGCGQEFRPHSQVPSQAFCSEAKCQLERRRRWQVAKRRSDPDYRDNQANAQQAWLKNHPDYWRQYRRSNPEYAAQNRADQSDRNRQNREPLIAKMDESAHFSPIHSGFYQIRPVGDVIAKMDVWTVKIRLISGPKPRPP
jgi:hypothetical protein